jgi:hypothetical protein
MRSGASCRDPSCSSAGFLLAMTHFDPPPSFNIMALLVSRALMARYGERRGVGA